MKLNTRKLVEIMNKHDPLALIKMGSPPDEYDSELNSIIKMWWYGYVSNEDDMLWAVHSIFVYMFGGEKTAGPKEHYKELAKDLYNAILEQK